MVAESSFTNLKATGVTYTVDDGGDSAGDLAVPQPQAAANPNTGNNLSRTIDEEGLLTLGFQGFLGQTNAIEWGKTAYQAGENGGISGIVFYATTRAEDDPKFAAGEEWEPGIPRVQVNLYADVDNNKIVDDLNGGGVQLADVDNYPQGNFPGVEDLDRNGNTTFDIGDALAVTFTDSWDDNQPAGCVQTGLDLIPSLPGNEIAPGQCFDGLRNFNQVREALFDGGYAFFEGDFQNGSGSVALASDLDYIVEAAAPAGYEHVKEEDKNVDFGETFVPSPFITPPECIGDPHLVPQYLSLQTSGGVPVVPAAELVTVLQDNGNAGQNLPLCDRKHIRLSDRKNAAVDFFMFTPTPRAARVVGVVLDDLANEFDPASPNFGEKYAPSWLPVSIRDFTGQEITRVVTDEFGKFNALLPSTYSMNLPTPSGASPNMLTACMNPAGDPLHNRQYSQFCYTFQFMPGTTTYLDTPVLPIAAYAGPDRSPLDCEYDDSTPIIAQVVGTCFQRCLCASGAVAGANVAG